LPADPGPAGGGGGDAWEGEPVVNDAFNTACYILKAPFGPVGQFQ